MSLTPQQIEAFLDSQPGWMIMTSLDPDGQPHSVPLGYFREGLVIYLGCREQTHKVANLRRDPRVTLLLESGRGEGRGLVGVMFQGRAQVLTDPGPVLELQRMLARRRGQPEPEAVRGGIAYIRVESHKITSWDRTHRS